jgi:hypothetical protein
VTKSGLTMARTFIARLSTLAGAIFAHNRTVRLKVDGMSPKPKLETSHDRHTRDRNKQAKLRVSLYLDYIRGHLDENERGFHCSIARVLVALNFVGDNAKGCNTLIDPVRWPRKTQSTQTFV